MTIVINLIHHTAYNVKRIRRKFTDEQESTTAIENYILFYNTKRYQKTAALYDSCGVQCSNRVGGYPLVE